MIQRHSHAVGLRMIDRISLGLTRVNTIGPLTYAQKIQEDLGSLQRRLVRA
jgi:hypothetical protein